MQRERQLTDRGSMGCRTSSHGRMASVLMCLGGAFRSCLVSGRLRNRLTQPSLSQFEILYSAFLRPSRLCHFEAVRCIFSTITRGRHKNALPDRSPTISRLAVLKTAAQIKKRDPDPGG